VPYEQSFAARWSTRSRQRSIRAAAAVLGMPKSTFFGR